MPEVLESMRTIRRHITDALLRFAMIGYARFTGLLPLSYARALGRGLAILMYYAVPRLRRSGLASLDLAYGDSLTYEEKIRILKGSFANFGIVASEFSRLPDFGTERGSGRVRVEGLEHVDRARGGLVIGAHQANWEWLAPGLSCYGPPVAEIVSQSRDPKRDAYIDGMRRRGGITTIPRDGAAASVRQALQGRAFVGMLLDQSPRTSAVPVTMFGAPCWASAAPALIAKRTGVPVYVVNMWRDDDGTYTVEFSPPISFEWTGCMRDDSCRLAQQVQDILESNIRERPEQWLWIYNRWKPREQLRRKWEERMAVSEMPAPGAGESASTPRASTGTDG